jgi:lipoate-protein ligase A
VCYNVYSDRDITEKRKEDKTMKTRKKYFMAHFVTNVYLEDEYEMFYAESKEAVEREVRETLGEQLIAVEVRKATWAEKRHYRKNNLQPWLVH